MILKACKTKNFTFYYVQKSFRTPEGKCSTKNVEKLGTIEALKVRFGAEDPIGEAKKYVAELTKAEKEIRKTVTVDYSPTLLIDKGAQRSYNGAICFFRRYITNSGWTISARR